MNEEFEEFEELHGIRVGTLWSWKNDNPGSVFTTTNWTLVEVVANRKSEPRPVFLDYVIVRAVGSDIFVPLPYATFLIYYAPLKGPEVSINVRVNIT